MAQGHMTIIFTINCASDKSANSWILYKYVDLNRSKGTEEDSDDVSEKNPNLSLKYVYIRIFFFCKNKGKINKMS